MKVKVWFKAATAIKGIRPLDLCVHKKILLTALGIIRRDGRQDAYMYYREHLSDLKKGIELGEEENHHSGSSSAAGIMEKKDKAARLAWEKGDCAQAMRLVGEALHALADTGVPLHNPLRLILQGDLYESYFEKRYQKGSHQRTKSGAILLRDTADYARHMQNTVKTARNITGDSRGMTRHDKMCAMFATSAEKLSAGYLIGLYDQMEDDKKMRSASALTLPKPCVLAQKRHDEEKLNELRQRIERVKTEAQSAMEASAARAQQAKSEYENAKTAAQDEAEHRLEQTEVQQARDEVRDDD